jgi:KDO2-lipid IV(A) lauroyltransferase
MSLMRGTGHRGGDARAPQGGPVPLPLWLRASSRVPLAAGYALSDALAFIAAWFGFYRRARVREQLRRCFPELTPRALRRQVRLCYRNTFDIVVELVRGAGLSADGIRARVAIDGLEPVRQQLQRGQSVLLIGVHYANWEWMLLALSASLGHPLAAAYKPLHDAGPERLLKILRARFGAELVPAKDLLNDVIRRRDEVRAIALVADQDPVSAELRHYTTFLGQETAFYMGAELIARAAKLPVYVVLTRRVARGRYRLTIESIATRDERPPQGEIMERYARKAEALIREQPSDWLWLHRRWKTKKPVYG